MTPGYERYAEALFNTAENLGCLDDIISELPAMEELVRQCGGYLTDPLIGTGKKTDLLRELLSGQVCPLMLEYVQLMTARRHLKHFFTAAEHFRHLIVRDIAVVRLRVPFQPDPDILQRLKRRLIKDKLIPDSVKDAEFRIVEDKDLIGGFVAYYDGYQIDTSLKTAINRLMTKGAGHGYD